MPSTPDPFKPSFEDRSTPAPKTKTFRARLWSGVYAEYHTLPYEMQDELQEIRDEYYARHPPASPEARCLVDQMIMCEWHLRRFHAVEESLWGQFGAPDAEDPAAAAGINGIAAFNSLQHRVNSTRRALHAALRELERLEARDRDIEVISPQDDTLESVPGKPFPVPGSLRKSS
jgi:hypothetical protein